MATGNNTVDLNTVGRRVVVTGLGALSPLGSDPSEIHEALVNGQRGLREIENFKTEDLDVHVGGEIAFNGRDYLGRERNLRPIDRTGQLTIIAAKLALEAAGLDPANVGEGDAGLVLGTMYGSVGTIARFDRRAVEAGPKYAKPFEFANSVINAAAGQTAIWYGLRGTNSTVAGGAAAGLKALAYAADQIRQGRADLLLAGGAEELCSESFLGFYRSGRMAGTHGAEAHSIPFAANRNGFLLGEGAAILVLESAESAAARGAAPLAEIISHGSAFDPSLGNDDTSAVAASQRAMQIALDAASEAASGINVDIFAASANGSPAGDRREAQALSAVLGEAARDLPVMAVRGALGESLGAGGAFQALTLVEAMRRREAPGIAGLESLEDGLQISPSTDSYQGPLQRGLLHAMSFEGSACAVVLDAPPSS